MNILIRAIEVFFLDLALKQRMWLLNRSENKMKKLHHKLRAETIYYNSLLNDSIKLCGNVKDKTE